MENKYKNIIVGDPHVKLNNLPDCIKLIDFIIELAKKEKPKNVIFLGDLFHNHAIIRLEVQDFWKNSIEKILEHTNVIALIGNHDKILGKSEYSGLHSLKLFKYMGNINNTIEIIDKPKIIDHIAYIPYRENHNQFIEESRELYNNNATELLIAHQSFTGATYDNGFYAEDAIEPELVCQNTIISGHIHKQQTIGKCFYAGTPKWDTMNDANERKGIWITTHNIENGSVIGKTFVSTEDVVTPIKKYIYKEEDSEKPKLNKGDNNYIELHGKLSWITKQKAIYKGKAKIKAVPTDRKKAKVETSELYSLTDWLNKFFEPIKNIDKESIIQYLKDLE